MKQALHCLRALALLLLASVPQLVLANRPAEETAAPVATAAERYFAVLAGRSDVFYDRSGPAFVMLIRASADTTDIGAFGIYAGDGAKPLFGAVPAATYEQFLQEPHGASDVMLRVAITPAQYDRVLKILRTWERRVREKALLYPEIALDNILLVKQAVEALDCCGNALVSYRLDWGLQDEISENNPASRIPFEYFKEIKRLNAARHVPDSDMPAALLSVLDTRQSGGGSLKER
jgi:hypothetical protein